MESLHVFETMVSAHLEMEEVFGVGSLVHGARFMGAASCFKPDDDETGMDSCCNMFCTSIAFGPPFAW